MLNLKEKIYKVLKRSQKYTQTDMVYLAKGGFWLGLGQTITSLAALALTFAFANLLSAKTFGTYRYVLSVAGILAIPTLSGMNTALLQAVARGKEGSFIPILKTKLKWGTLASLGSIITGGYYLLQGNNTLGFAFLIISLFLPLINSFIIYESFWGGKKRFDIQNKYRIITHILATCIVILTLIFTKNIFIILLAYFSSWTVLHFIFLGLTMKKVNFNKEQDEKTIPYGKHLSLLSIMGKVDNNLDKIILWHFLGPASIAIYFIALALPLKIKDVFKVIPGLAMPKFSQRTSEELKKTVPKRMLQMLVIITPIIVLYIILAPFIFKLLFPKYLQFVAYSQVYALALFAVPRSLAGTSLSAKMKTKSLWISNLVLPPIYILSLFILVPQFGIWGAISALLILEAITFSLQFYLFKKM
ncbi:MAG: oligosaccharide flippase family protein [Parcubacteria group bacterium]|nr:oligosaccharide flippase family protein [Parcubacteria group bacterium]